MELNMLYATALRMHSTCARIFFTLVHLGLEVFKKFIPSIKFVEKSVIRVDKYYII